MRLDETPLIGSPITNQKPRDVGQSYTAMEETLIASIANYEKMISNLIENGYTSSNMFICSLCEKKHELEKALRTLKKKTEEDDIKSYKCAMLKKVADKFDAETAKSLKNGWTSFLDIDALFVQAFPNL